MTNYIQPNEKILIAGSSGMAGSAICRSLIRSGYGQKKFGGELLKPSRQQLNLLRSDEVYNWFKINRPSVVIIAAAKVGGILANKTKPTEFLLENLKIQNNLIETSWKFRVKRFPEIDPEIKLIPIIKLIGKLTVSPIINLILPLFELFCIPIIKSKNKAEFKVMVNNIFLKKTNIF